MSSAVDAFEFTPPSEAIEIWQGDSIQRLIQKSMNELPPSDTEGRAAAAPFLQRALVWAQEFSLQKRKRDEDEEGGDGHEE